MPPPAAAAAAKRQFVRRRRAPGAVPECKLMARRAAFLFFSNLFHNLFILGKSFQ
jgi:hypothetical protein